MKKVQQIIPHKLRADDFVDEGLMRGAGQPTEQNLETPCRS
jgi:hypothetical protein